MTHAWYPSTGEGETGELLQVQAQLGLHETPPPPPHLKKPKEKEEMNPLCITYRLAEGEAATTHGHGRRWDLELPVSSFLGDLLWA